MNHDGGPEDCQVGDVHGVLDDCDALVVFDSCEIVVIFGFSPHEIFAVSSYILLCESEKHKFPTRAKFPLCAYITAGYC
jgi:hypothetical protein